MGTDPGQSSTPAVTVASDDPAALHRQIEATRAELGDLVAALAVKADVRKLARERVADIKQQARTRFASARQRARERRAALIGSGDGASAGPTTAVTTASRTAAEQARAHPLPLAIAAAAAAGFLIGRWAGR